MNILILIILIITILYLYKKQKENFDMNTLNKITDCNDTTNEIIFNTVFTNDLTISSKKINEYLLDIVYPIGSFYVQFPDVSDNQISRAFPEDLTPAKLFGGLWEIQWEKDAVFFRTEGGYSSENRNSNGIQSHAMLRLSGLTSLTQTDYRFSNNNNGTGVFGTGTIHKNVGTDSDSACDKESSRDFFDIAASAIAGSEVRVRNRIIRIWKRVG